MDRRAGGSIFIPPCIMLKNALHRVVDAYKVTAFNCQVFRDNCMMTKTFPQMRGVVIIYDPYFSL